MYGGMETRSVWECVMFRDMWGWDEMDVMVNVMMNTADEHSSSQQNMYGGKGIGE